MPWDTNRNLLEEANRLYDEAGTFDCVEKGDLVAIKIHIGELGNPYYIQPFFVHEIVRRVKELGGKPFLTDSNTLYEAQRSNAYDHMYNALMNGFNMAPFIVADGLKSENFSVIKTKGILSEVEVSGAFVEADALIVVSHCKGHELCGFGGAIKNLAMGCTSKDGKLRQHRSIGIEIDTSKCIGCGKCKEACSLNLPDIIEGKAYITSEKCIRCPICIGACPVQAIHFVNKRNLSLAFASAAFGVLSTFKRKKVTYVSFAKNVTENCDCCPTPGDILFKDIGIFASESAVSIDSAFLKAINIEVLNSAAKVDCFTQLKEAKRIGIKGKINPEIKVLS